MEYLGEDHNKQTSIWQLQANESRALMRFLRAVNKIDNVLLRSSAWLTEAERAKGFETIDQLAQMLEQGPIKLTFEPVEFKG